MPYYLSSLQVGVFLVDDVIRALDLGLLQHAVGVGILHVGPTALLFLLHLHVVDDTQLLVV